MNKYITVFEWVKKVRKNILKIIDIDFDLLYNMSEYKKLEWVNPGGRQ